MAEGRTRLGRDLDKIALAALTVELAATLAAHESHRWTGVNAAFRTPSGRIETIGATVLGNAVPIGLFALSLMGRRRSPVLSGLAAALALAGSATMADFVHGGGGDEFRTSAGNQHALRPAGQFAAAAAMADQTSEVRTFRQKAGFTRSNLRPHAILRASGHSFCITASGMSKLA